MQRTNRKDILGRGEQKYKVSKVKGDDLGSKSECLAGSKQEGEKHMMRSGEQD